MFRFTRLTRLSVQLLFTGLCLLAALLPALADTEIPYTPAALAAAQDAGKSIIVDVYAPWCPFCARQQRVLTGLQTEPEFKDVVIFRLDFDHQKEEMKAFRANRQSTLIGFHGKKETGRVTWAVSTNTIRNLLTSTLK